MQHSCIWMAGRRFYFAQDLVPFTITNQEVNYLLGPVKLKYLQMKPLKWEYLQIRSL